MTLVKRLCSTFLAAVVFLAQGGWEILREDGMVILAVLAYALFFGSLAWLVVSVIAP